MVTGVGSGTGRSLVEKFGAEGYQVAMMARKTERLEAFAREIPNTHAFPCDVTDESAVNNVLQAIDGKLGAVDVLVHNAVGGAFGHFLEIDSRTLQTNFDINVKSLLHLCQSLIPSMASRGHGVVLATGNTSAYRGKANFAAFAPTKAAQRILLESIARHAGPQGVHVGYVAIDAVIDLPWTRRSFPEKPDDFFCKSADIAAECYRIAHQPRSAWSFNVEIRPYAENW